MRRRVLIALLVALATFLAVGSFSAVADNGLPDCSDNLDNDNDGFTDFAGGDPGCSSDADNREVSGANICDNGLDDDGDGLKDFGGSDNSPTEPDPGCSSPTDTDETDDGTPPPDEGDTECSDGIDNDGDGLIDGDDPDGADDPTDDDDPADDDGEEDGEDEPDPATLDPGCENEADDDESDDNGHENNVTGTKYHDGNLSGAREEPEAGIEGFEIHLFNEDGSVHEHTTTGADGSYGFLVEPGTYTLCETLSDDPALSQQTDPSEGADCSGHDAGEGETGPFGYEVTITDEAGSRSDGNDFGNGGGNGDPECNDGLDNDEDGLIDFIDDGDDDGEPGQEDDGDPDCDDNDDSETPECNDGIDNDGDGKIDFADDGDDDGEPGQEDDGDPDCDDADDDDEGATDPQCSDGVDNEDPEDELIDEADPGCINPDTGEYDPADDDETDAAGTTCSTDYDGDGTQHSSFAPDQNEDGLISGPVHSLDQGLVVPLVTADGGVVPEVNCAVVKGILGL